MRKFFVIILFLNMLFSGKIFANTFIPEQKILPVSKIRAGESGYMLTVLQGMKISKIPIKIISVVPQKPSKNISDLILIKLNNTLLAKGMSGSPVYVRGKLIGAVVSGWEFSDHSLAYVTPIESMCKIFDNKNYAQTLLDKNYAGIFTVAGLSRTQDKTIIHNLERSLGVEIIPGISSSGRGFLQPENYVFKPGDSISALLVWGDVEVSSTGVVTATSKDGKFLAFGHPFLRNGRANYPAAKSFIHETVKSTSFPFKLASPVSINGTITRDTEAGIGGETGYYAPSIPNELVFKNLDDNTRNDFHFRVIANEFLTAKLLEGVYTGLMQSAWGRQGAGTMAVTLRIDAKGVNNGWTRKDIFFSDENIITNSFKQATQIIKTFLTQPFADAMPISFSVEVEATEFPKVLIIEDIETVSRVKAGEEFDVRVTLRAWRGQRITKKFTLRMPEDATGVSELIVRGGSTQPLSQLAVEEGWKSIDSLELMLREIKALDAGNELIIELSNDNLNNALKKALARKKSKNNIDDDLLPEQQEYLSETKIRRIKEGTLRIFSSDYLVDGMMKRIIRTDEK